MKHIFPVVLVAALLTVTAAFYISGCKKPEIRLSTTNDVNILGYLLNDPDSFSLWTQILDKTETSSFLDAYGSYTVFVPSNSGVQRWLAANGMASVDAADVNLLKEIVKFHILEDTISTPGFTDGKLPVPTMHGQFLITGAINKDATSSYTVNRQAVIWRSNVRVGNGYIHAIDYVLTPSKTTIAKQLEADPGYSIFVEALKETGFFKILDTSLRWLTVLAEPNLAYADSGIHSYAELKDKFADTAAVTKPHNKLNLYVAYHILTGIQFLGDIITVPSHLTLQPQEVISTKLINNEVVINEDVFNGVLEKGVVMIRNQSDHAAVNGVWHTAGAHFASKLRMPTAVYWDLAAFPEIMKQPAYYGKQNYRFNKSSQEDRPIQDIDWHYNGENYVQYEYGTTSSLHNYACNNDILSIPLGAPSNNNRAQWIEFTTPPIIKGRYKVWICHRNRSSVTINVFVDGELMERPVNLAQGYPGGTDAERESLNWKRYTLGGTFAGRCVGVANIRTTERHKLRFEAISGSNRSLHFDMVHFIPVDQVQYLPRFAPDGSQVWE